METRIPKKIYNIVSVTRFDTYIFVIDTSEGGVIFHDVSEII